MRVEEECCLACLHGRSEVPDDGMVFISHITWKQDTCTVGLDCRTKD